MMMMLMMMIMMMSFKACSATNPTGLPRKLKITPITLPTIAGNASTALPARLLRASTSLFSHIFKAPSSFGGEAGPPPPLPPRTPVIASAFVESHSKGCKYWYYCNTLFTKYGMNSICQRHIYIKDILNGFCCRCCLCSLHLMISSVLW